MWVLDLRFDIGGEALVRIAWAPGLELDLERPDDVTRPRNLGSWRSPTASGGMAQWVYITRGR